MKDFDEWFGEFGSEEDVDAKVTPSPRKLNDTKAAEAEFFHYMKKTYEDESEEFEKFEIDLNGLVLDDDDEDEFTATILSANVHYAELSIDDYAGLAEMEVKRGVNPEDLGSEYYVSFMLKELGYNTRNLDKDQQFPVLFLVGNYVDGCTWYQLVNNREHITFDFAPGKIIYNNLDYA